MFGLFKKKILVAEDSEALYKAIIFELERSGYKVFVAHSFEEAAKHINSGKKFSALWLDHALQGEKTGLDVLRYARTKKKLKDVPVYVVSAVEEYREQYLNEDITKYFEKSNYLLNTIIRAIRNDMKNKKNG